MTDAAASRAEPAPAPGSALESRARAADRKAIAVWLLAVAGLVFLMVVVGGATRLTESGLSITEWKPITGVVPPLTTEAWEAELEKYRQIPEYQLINKGMSLDDFKVIYYWEWGHRLLGRIIGLAFFIPFVYFLVTKRVERRYVPRLAALFVLGGLQGFMGWYMVQSGLTERVDVSQYRLTAHLSLALVIFAALVWTALDMLRPPARYARKASAAAVAPSDGPAVTPLLWAGVLVFVTLLVLQIVMGGFVAGLNAGFIYNTWPLMDGALVPDGLFRMDPWWLNFFESHLTSQFTHRVLAYALLAAAAVVFLAARRSTRAIRLGASALLALVVGQALLGIWTLLAVVPVSLGTAHQGGAVLVLGAAVFLVHETARVRAAERRSAAAPLPHSAAVPAE